MTLEDHLKVQSKKWIAEGESRAKIEAVHKLVESGLCDVKKACEILDVSFEDYAEHMKSPAN